MIIINKGEHTVSYRDQPEDDWQWVQERYQERDTEDRSQMMEELGIRLLYRAVTEMEEGRMMMPLVLRSWLRPVNRGSKISLTICPRI